MTPPADHPSDDQWAVVFESDTHKPCSDRALVMLSLGIACEVIHDSRHSALVVPAALAERAKFELWQYEQENRAPAAVPPALPLAEHDGIPGVILYILIVCATGWFAGEQLFGRDWLAAGRVDGELIRQGEWWRVFTALTLHSGIRHLLGNLGFGIFFGLFAGRLAGSGVAWFAIVIASGAANALNTVLLESGHRSIGASTAVFAALGLMAGFVWRAKVMVQDRWPYRLGPIIGGIALLAFTGTGDENTDIGAHLAGFVCGFVAGIVLTLMRKHLPDRRLQTTCGLGALVILLVAWLAALNVGLLP